MKSDNEVNKEIRAKLKAEFPDCKFSVVKRLGAMCIDTTIALMSAPFDAIIGGKAWQNGYAQLNEYQLKGKAPAENFICNGAMLTKQCWNTMKRVIEIAEETGSYDYQNSFLSVHIGKWDKPFIRRNNYETNDPILR